MNKRITKGISLVLTIALVFSMFSGTAFAQNGFNQRQNSALIEGETEPAPSDSEAPQASESPAPSESPSPSESPAPSQIPEPTEQPEPSTSPQPDTEQPEQPDILQSLVDSNGYLTDEGLESLQTLPYDSEKYIENVDNEDGTKSVKLYSGPIKYKDKDGIYKYIDNSIVTTDSKDNLHQYKNAASDIQLLLSDNLNQNSAIQMNYLDYSIGFTPLGILKKGDKSSAGLKFTQNENSDKKDISYDKSKKYDTVNYSGTFDNNTDINIIPNSTGVKENIILNEMPEITEFSYELTVENVVPLLRQDGNVYFVDLSKGLIVAVIPIPTMCDSTPEAGPEVIPVTLKELGDNRYKYTISPEKSFLENAVYPVVIDPTISTVTSGGVEDAYLRNTSSGTNFSGQPIIVTGHSNTGNIYRSLVKINDSGLTSLRNSINSSNGKVIQVVYHAYQSYSPATSYPVVEIHPVQASWNSTLVTWGNQPAVYGILTSQTVHEVRDYQWDVTSVGLDWFYGNLTHSGPSYGNTTYGILLKIESENLIQYKEYGSVETADGHPDYFEFKYADAPDVSVNTSDWTNDTITVSWSDISALNDIPVYPNDPLPIDFTVQYATSSTDTEPDPGSFTTISGSDNQASGSSSALILPEGQMYVFIRAFYNGNAAGPAGYCQYKLDITPPTAPTGLTSSSVTEDSVSLAWTASTDNASINGYDVYRNSTYIGSSANASYTDSGLSLGTSYTYTVKAKDAAGNESDASESLEITPSDATPPSAPASAAYTSVSDTTVTLTWTASTDNVGVTGYRVYRDGVQVGTETNTTYTDSDLGASTAYSYTIKAEDAAGNLSDASNTVNVTTTLSFTYSVSGNNATITGYTGSKGTVIIPSVIAGKTVVAVGNSSFAGKTSIRSITIPNSVTSIGNYAFYYCTGLTSITIPSSVTSIGNNAFRYCPGLTSIAIPSSVTNIREYAFYYCSGLTSITIPSSVTSIGNSAFQGCSELTSITIPSGVSSIGYSAFQDCRTLTSITIPDGLISIGNSVYQGCSGLTSITIPSSVTSIGNSAFQSCSGLTGITVPSGVTSIGDSAFQGCSGLTGITIPNSVTSIGNAVFSGCSGLTSITIPSGVTSIGNSTFQDCSGLTNITIPSGVTSIGDSAFYNCTGLTGIIIPDGVTSILDSAFSDCTGLTSITIPESVTSIGNYTFYNCTGLTSITIPNGITSIGECTFYGCTGLTSIIIPTGVTSIGDSSFQGCSGLTSITIPDSVTTIGDSALYGCTGLTGVTIPDGVIGINNYAFCDCTGLTSITIPNTVSTVGDYAFINCSNLAAVTLPSSASLGTGVFSGCSSSLAITVVDTTPPSVPANLVCTSITGTTVNLTWTAPTDNVGVTGYNIYRDGVEVGNCAAASYTDTGLSEGITYTYTVTAVDAGENESDLSESLAITTDGTPPTAPADLSGTDITETSVTLAWAASTDNIGVTGYSIYRNGVEIGSTADTTYIDNSASPSALYIYSVTAKDAAGNESTSSAALEVTTPDLTPPTAPADLSCTDFEDTKVKLTWTASTDNAGVARYIVYRNGVQTGTTINTMYIDSGLGANTNYSYTIKAQDAADNISDASNTVNVVTTLSFTYTVNADDTLTITGYIGTALNVVIPSAINGKTVNALGDNVFIDNVSITGISISSGVTSIGNNAFHGCTGLTSITIPDSVTSIGDSAFYGCSGLTGIVIPDSVTSIGDFTFCDCTGLTSLTIPDGITSIGNSAFRNCALLTNVTIPASVTSIGDAAFYGCTGITSISIPSGVTIIGNSTFNGCAGLTGIAIPDGITSIEDYAFSGCTGLTSVTIPNSVTSIDNYAFQNCGNLAAVTMPSSAVLGTGVFEGCSSSLVITVIDTTPPSVPAGLAFTSITGNTVDLTWAAPADNVGVTGYNIYRDGVLAGNSAAASYNDTGLSEGTTYTYTVTAVDAAGNESGASEALVITADGTPPTAPADLAGTNITETSVTLTWTASTDSVAVTGYNIYRNGVEVGSAADVTYIDTGLSPSTLYVYTVTAKDVAGNESAASAALEVTTPDLTPPSAPADLSCTDIEDTKVKLTWTASADNVGVTGYKVYRNGVQVGTTINTMYIDSGLWARANYSYVIKAQDAAGNISEGNGIVVKTTLSFNYTENEDGTLVITGYTGIDPDVIIPAVICDETGSISSGKVVTAIGESSFIWNSNITSVAIPGSVIIIGNSAFKSCTSLTSAAIGNSVAVIGNNAFESCVSLTSVGIGDSVATIGNSAFSGCRSLTSITIPDSVTAIGEQAFSYSGIIDITIPHSVNLIGLKAFYWCQSLTNIYVDTDNQYFRSLNGVLYDKNREVLLQYPIGNTRTEFNIPSGVITIGAGAFCCGVNLYDVWIPNGVVNIDTEAFYATSNLTDIVIPDSVVFIGASAFEGSSLSNGVTLSNNLTVINTRAFCATNLTAVSIPNGVTRICDGAFGYSSSLESAEIPVSVTEIGNYAFAYCERLAVIPHLENVTSIGDWAFCGCPLGSLSAGNGTLSIGENAFADCTSLQDISLYGYTSIGTRAFSNCTSITSLYLYSSQEIGDFAFERCSGIEFLYVFGGNIGQSAFLNCTGLFSATIDASSIEGFAFSGCSSLASAWIRLSGSVGELAFTGCTGLGSVYIDASDIGQTAFVGCEHLSSCTLGSHVRSIGNFSFSGTGLGTMTIPESVTSIGIGAFSQCQYLFSMNIPDTVTFIGSGAFNGCPNLSTVTIGNGITVIFDSTFENCIKLSSITLPESLLYIGPYAFKGCTALENIVFPVNLKLIAEEAFANCGFGNVLFLGLAPICAKNAFGSGIDNIHFDFAAQSYIDGINKIYGDPVDTLTGAHKIELDLMDLEGARNCPLTINYDSSQLTDGTMGKAWYNNYEIKMESLEDGSMRVYWNPSSFSNFTENTDGTFTCGTRSFKNYVLSENPDGSYTLNCNYNKVYRFDSEGKLINIRNRTGMELALTYSTDSLVVTEPISGKYITLHYNTNGLVERASDSSGREVVFGYNEKSCLTSIIDVNGDTVTYTYDCFGHVLTGTDGDGVLYFTDTYDDQGRVSTQDDAVEGNLLTYFSYDTTSVPDQTTVTVTDRNGKTLSYVYNSLNQLISETDQNGKKTTYTYDTNGNRASKTDPLDHTVLTIYDDNNRLVEEKDPEAATTTYNYDSRGNLLSKVEPGGGTTTYVYDSNNNFTSVTDKRGNTTTYGYNSNGLLTEKTTSNSSYTYAYNNGMLMTITDQDSNVTSYTYDGAGRLASSTDSDGNDTSYTYDDAGNLLSKTDELDHTISYTYNSRGKVRTETDARGNTITYQYNGNGILTRVINTKGKATAYSYDGEDRLTGITDALNNVKATVYDDAGRVLSNTDEEGNKTSYTYDDAGNVLTVTSPGEGEVSYTYYRNGKVKTQTDAAGNDTTYGFDTAWRVDTVTNDAGKDTVYDYNNAGDLLSVTDPLGNETSFTYDTFGNQLTQSDAKGNVTTYTYDENNNRTSQTDALDNTTTYVYDDLGNMTQSTDANNHTTTYTYNAAGKLTEVTDALGNTTGITYDPNGNVLTTTDALGNIVSEITYDSENLPLTVEDALGNLTQNTYDDLGRLTQTTDPLSQITAFGYDDSDRLVSATDALNGLSSYTYDPDGGITDITAPNNSSVEFAYDDAGRLTAKSTASGGAVTFGYNNLNLLDLLTNARDQETACVYDDAGRITSFTNTEGTTSFTYDDNNNVLTVTDSNGTITRVYDELNRVTSYTDTNNNVIQYTYDPAGNLSTVVYPDNKTVEYGYNAVNQLITVTDWDDRVTTYSYNDNGWLTGASRPDGSEITYTYDLAGRLTGITDTDASDNVICSYSYTLDANGQITAEIISNGELTSTMVYDDLGRVSSREDTDENNNVIGTYSYAYDNAGNITSGTAYGQTAAMAYDAQNKLTTYNSQSVTYDADGNMTSGPLGGVLTSFEFDSGNRLTQAGGTDYAYDALNNRISATTSGSTTEYVYDTVSDRLSRLLVVTAPGGGDTYYVYGLGLIGQETANGDYSVYHFDMRGSTTAVTDISGAVTDTYTYGAYGDLLGHTGSGSTPFLYNGRDGVMTENNGLYYLRSRYYSPEIMRFINEDTVDGTIRDSRTLNKYAYAKGNPISFVDPLGTSSELAKAMRNAGFITPDAGNSRIHRDEDGNYILVPDSDLTNIAYAVGGALFPGDFLVKGIYQLSGDQFIQIDYFQDIYSIGLGYAGYAGKVAGAVGTGAGYVLTGATIAEAGFGDSEEINQLTDLIYGELIRSSTSEGCAQKYYIYNNLVRIAVSQGIITYTADIVGITEYEVNDEAMQDLINELESQGVDFGLGSQLWR